MTAFEWLMAVRYLRARREERLISVIGWFSFSGIALGVATLIVVMSVMNGFRGQFLERILGLNGHLVVYGPERKLEPYGALAAALEGLEGVVHASPVVEAQVMVSAGGFSTGALVRGVLPEDLARRETLADRITAGSLDGYGGRDAVVLGSRLAGQLGLAVGDRLTLISPRLGAESENGGEAVLPALAAGLAPRMGSFRVVALFNAGMFEFDSTYIFMPQAAARDFFDLGRAVTGIELFLARPLLVGAARRQVAALVQSGGEIVDWQQANAALFIALNVERAVMFVILTLIILVAAFNIIASLIMLVKDKGRDIAILRTMGATRGAIMRIFVLSGATIGAVGTLLGLLLGLSAAVNIEAMGRWLDALATSGYFAAELNFLSQLPTRIDATEVAMVVAMGLVLSVLATLYPSWRAARLDPVEALRYE